MYKPNFTELTSFAAVVRHRSFRAAAAELEVTPSALSHTLRNLEERLDLRLLNRTTRSVAPTDVGDWLFLRIKPLLQEFDQTFSDLNSQGAVQSGNLKISLGALAAKVLCDTIVPAFRSHYPKIKLDLEVSGLFVDIVSEGFDAGVRFRDAIPKDMIIVNFGGEYRFTAVASPEYLKDRASIQSPHDLNDHDCIRYRMPSGKMHSWKFAKNGEEIRFDVPGQLTLNNPELMRTVALNHGGIAYILDSEAEPYIQDGRLVEVLPEWSSLSSGFCLYYPGHRHVPPSLRALVEIIKSCRRK